MCVAIPPLVGSQRPRGVALVIVLAFIVLLSGLVVAFFSRSLSERQISNSSAGQAKVDLSAQGAIDTIVGDLKQEIADGSVLPLPTPAQDIKLYVPKPGTTSSPSTAIPAFQISTGYVPATTNGVETDGLGNLLKRSAYGVPFYPASANYAATGVSRAAQSPTTNFAMGGRSISLARWNKPLLLSKQNGVAGNDSDLTPTTKFTAPDWILVGRDNSNPTAWSTDLQNSSKPNYPLSRYAYTIYDEGGLLDANAAGYPASNYPSSGAAPFPVQPTRKNALAYADLTALIPQDALNPTGGTQPMLTAGELNALVGWRNFASGQPTGTFPNYTPAPTPAAGLSPFDLFVLTNKTGFLTTARLPLTATKQSDRMFSSRQELINLLLKGVSPNGTAGANERAKLQNALQYLGTFSRALNQPSFVPPTFAAFPAPLVNARASGGNTAVDRSGNNGTQVINPSFLTVRAASAFVRNDGSLAVAGTEPLVKKRFALDRLAWLTYAGPITLDGINYNAGLSSGYVSTLKNTYGLTDAFLLQGTPANVFKYFGLGWVKVTDPVDSKAKPMWVYNHSGMTVPGTASAAGSIKVLSNKPLASVESTSVVAAGREPDFFELLKAAVNVGSIAKSGAGPDASGNPPTGVVGAQYNHDISVDFAIVQLAANIIDQYDLDSYPTTIYFDDTSAAYGSYIDKQFHGIENLPYLNRLRCNVIKASLPQKATGGASPYGLSPFANAGTNVISQTGIGQMMQLPELWNPHDWDANNTTNQSNGLVGPTQFRIFSVGDTAAGYFSSATTLAYAYRSSNSATTDATKDTGGSLAWYTSQFTANSIRSPKLRTLSFDNTVMTFTYANNMFREPTVLYMAGKTGGLAAPGLTGAPSGGTTTNASLSAVSELSAAGKMLMFGGEGFKSAVPDPATVGAAATQQYVGFYVGSLPLRWVSSDSPAQCYSAAGPRSDTAFSEMVYLQYQDSAGNWVNYDEKYFDNPYNNLSNLSLMNTASTQFFDVAAAGSKPFLVSSVVVDPRTARFGTHIKDLVVNSNYGWNADAPFEGTNGWITSSPTDVWVDGANGVVQTLRSDTSAGTSVIDTSAAVFPAAGGWYPGNPNFNQGQLGRAALRPGLLSQNDPTLVNDGKITASSNTAGPFSGAPDSQYQFYADADGIVRRGMGAYVPGASGGTLGLPMATANSVSAGMATRNATQSPSRPVVLNRPFRSVADLGYAFSGTPWRNVDFSTAESGSSPLLDVFCLSDTDDPSGLEAGKVDLNTRQFPVLQAIVAGAYEDEWKVGTASDGLTTANGIDPAKVATTLASRTIGNPAAATPAQPLTNLADLVGRWNTATVVTAPSPNGNNQTDGKKSYTGFAGDPALTTALGTTAGTIQRYREAPIRALSNAGQTRVWNLMIDLVAQTGRYSVAARKLDDFSVEGEQRYWVHLAIDRFTGEVIDKQVEEVKE